MDCSLPGSSVHGIFQASVLEWGAIAFSKANTTLTLMIILSLLLYSFTIWAHTLKHDSSLFSGFETCINKSQTMDPLVWLFWGSTLHGILVPQPGIYTTPPALEAWGAIGTPGKAHVWLILISIKVCEIYPRCCVYEEFVPFHCWVPFPCMNMPYFIHSPLMVAWVVISSDLQIYTEFLPFSQLYWAIIKVYSPAYIWSAHLLPLLTRVYMCENIMAVEKVNVLIITLCPFG